MKKLFLSITIAGLAFTSCKNEDTTTNLVAENENTTEIPQEVLSKLIENDINTNDVEVVDFMYPNGEIEKAYRMEGDLTMTEKQILDMGSVKGLKGRQYHTYNLVSQNTVIDIIGYDANNGNGLSDNEKRGLRWAVDNYNRLNLNISFNLTFGTDYDDKDMVVYHNPNRDFQGGEAGFPQWGRPHKWVQIHGLANANTNTIEHVLTHEIGHSIGLRHTDWFSRRSCGQDQNEGAGNIGAEHIPGTPKGYDSTSLMLACFGSSPDGELNSNDVTTLRYLYQ